MPTKAELENTNTALLRKIARLERKHENFRKTVVKVGLQGCNDHGWCNEIKTYLIQMGLGELLEPTWAIQRRNSSTEEWHSYSDNWDDLEEAKSYRDELNQSEQRFQPGREFRVVQIGGTKRVKVIK